MGIFKKYTKKITILVLLIAIILASLAVKVVNLNYNSPFNDEAIYLQWAILFSKEFSFWSLPIIVDGKEPGYTIILGLLLLRLLLKV